MKNAWENGQRVPVTSFRTEEEEDDEPRPERSALVMSRRIIGLLLADPNPKLGVECMALVTGIGYEGDAMADIARRHKVTRQAVSKRCIELSEAFGLPPVRAMRPVRNRERCRKARLRSIASA